MTRRKLPIGIQTFQKVREEDCYYVDKTAYIQRLVDEGTHYFLSRPRRFGKSLFLDTLKELFEGNEALFAGLKIHRKWDWAVRHPVLRLSFGGGNFKAPGFLEANFAEKLAVAERQAQLANEHSTPPGRFAALLSALHRQAGRPVVVLVDEYDKPILDALDAPDIARANRDFLRGVYSVIKDCDAHVRFTFLTGVSRFSKVSLFSGLNNLIDITLDPAFSAICGYTEKDLDNVFAPELEGLDRAEVRRWYNGYNWLGKKKVYNPYDILLLFRRHEFAAHWFETGSPAFLVETLLKRGVSPLDLEGMVGTSDLLSAFDVDDMSTEALLFQTGYLTIDERSKVGDQTVFRLSYPNQEVRQSLSESLLRQLVGRSTRQGTNSIRLHELLTTNDFAGLKRLFHAFYASIPHQWYTNDDIARFEGYYAAVFYSYFAGLGLDIVVEDSSSHGRLDMAVRFNNNVYLFEFKVVELAPEGGAMAQLQANYANKYRALRQPIHLIAVEFSKESRDIVAFEVKPA